MSLGLRFALGGSRPLLLSIIYIAAYVIVIEMMIDYDRPNTGFVTISLTPMTDQLHRDAEGAKGKRYASLARGEREKGFPRNLLREKL